MTKRPWRPLLPLSYQRRYNMNKMKNMVLVLTLAVSLGGCQFFKNIETAFQTGDITASVANPVTLDTLNKVENAAILLFTGLNAWKSTCAQGLIPASCKVQIANVQVYSRKIPPYLVQLRAFVRNNDQVNAIVLFNQIT